MPNIPETFNGKPCQACKLPHHPMIWCWTGVKELHHVRTGLDFYTNEPLPEPYLAELRERYKDHVESTVNG